MIPVFKLDAFAESPFTGNPAAVCWIEGRELSETLMQSIAFENNLSETAFIRPLKTEKSEAEKFEIRWFTPANEARLCGHATLAASWVIFERYRKQASELIFESQYSGELRVRKIAAGMLELDFPIYTVREGALPIEVSHALGLNKTTRGYISPENGIWILLCDTQEQVEKLRPDFAELAKLPGALIATARGSDCDFVYRYFDPYDGIPEDPVTGSAQCYLAPLWAKLLETSPRSKLRSRQLSQRGGKLEATIVEDRILISGQVRLFLEGQIHA